MSLLWHVMYKNTEFRELRCRHCWHRKMWQPAVPPVTTSIHIHFRLRGSPCPILWVWQHQAMSNTGSLSCESTPARPPLLTSVFTHSDHVFRCLSFFLMSGIWQFVIDLIQNVARCTWPYHLSRWQRMTEVISSMSSFCSGEAEDTSSLSLIPWIQRIIARSLWRSCRSPGSFGRHFSLPWNIAERIHATNTLPHILGERCLEVRTGKSFLNFLQSTQHLATMTLSRPPPLAL